MSALIEPDQTLPAVFNTLLAQQEGLKLSIMAILLHFNNIFIVKSKLNLLLNSKFFIYITSWISNVALLLNTKREALYLRERVPLPLPACHKLWHKVLTQAGDKLSLNLQNICELNYKIVLPSITSCIYVSMTNLSTYYDLF